MKDQFYTKYKHKIVSLKKLLSRIKKNKNKKTVMCHGVFDVVHPGHVRHLVYAKSKADILVVSLTADKFIKKGIYRPHVPERIRALNLAAFEMVDYVIIDNHSTSIYNINQIKPDYFAKGFEYDPKKKQPIETQEEIKNLNKFGGKMIFTPGDVVYSSSKFLKLSEPNIRYEKLIDIMESNKISFSDLKSTLKKFNNLKVHVVGDTIVDEFLNTILIGGQIKTPTLSLLEGDLNKFAGGAAIVASHMSAAGAKVTFTTVLGNDENKKFISETFKKNKVKCNFFSEVNRPTTSKKVIINENHRLIKLDRLDNTPINETTIKKIISKIKKISADAIIFSDFRHGIFNKETIPLFTKAINKKCFKVADSQVATRWGNITEFKNFDLITPNEKEARFAVGDQDSTVDRLTKLIHESSNFKNIILKLGKRGVYSMHKTSIEEHKGYSIDSFADNVIDPVGSGDALLAYSTLSMLVTKSLLLSSIIGSFAAAVACENNGNETVLTEQLLKKIVNVEKLAVQK